MTDQHSPPPMPPRTPVLGHTLPFARDPLGFVRGAVEDTGDVFRADLLGKDVTFVADPDCVGTVLTDRETFGKLDDFRLAFGDALLAVEGDQWRRQRDAMEGFFGPARLRERLESMVETARTRSDGWADEGVVRVDEAMRAVALRNLFEVLLGESLSGEAAADLADDAHALNGWFKPTSWALPEWVPTPARYRFRRGEERLRERARDLLAAAGDDTGDGDGPGDSLLATLARLRDDPDSEFDDAEVLDQVVGMLFAGHETTALAMTYALHQVGAHPDVQRRLRAELDDAVEGRVSAGDLDGLTILDRVIDETLRLYPPVHAIPRVATERTELGGCAIPAGEPVLVSVWALHRDGRFYDAPRTFDPDRWADAGPRDRGFAFVPFGAGPRVCIGRHFARLELTATLAAVVRRYDLTAVGDIEVAPRMTTQPDGPVEVRAERR